jgi:hypothetical protein
MPELSVEFWIGFGFAFIALIVGLGVTLAMDARTKGEFRFAAICFILCAAISIYGLGAWQMSVVTPAWLRTLSVYLTCALILTLAGEAIRWAHGRHLRATAIEGEKGSSNKTESKSEAKSEPEIKPNAHSEQPTKPDKSTGTPEVKPAPGTAPKPRHEIPKVKIVSASMSGIQPDNTVISEVIYTHQTKKTLRVLSVHAFDLIMISPGPKNLEVVTPDVIQRELKFREAEELAWKEFEDHREPLDHQLFFDSVPDRNNRIRRSFSLTPRYSPEAIQAIRDRQATLFMTGRIVYLDGDKELETHYCIYLIGADGETGYCSKHN